MITTIGPHRLRSRRLLARLLAGRRRRLRDELRERAEWAKQARDVPRLQDLVDPAGRRPARPAGTEAPGAGGSAW